MAGIFLAKAVMNERRRALSYVVASPNSFNPIFKNFSIRAYEFHYSKIDLCGKASFAYGVSRGSGIVTGKDGMTVRNTLGTYMHQHALSNREWSQNIIDKVQSS